MVVVWCLLPVWSTASFWIPEKPQYLRSMLSKSMRCPENCNACSQHWSTERAQFSTTTPDCTLHNQRSKVGQIGLKRSALSAIFTWPLLPDYHFFKHLNNFLRAICFYNQQEAENAFQEFVEYWSMDFYATGLSKLISCWQKCIDYNGSHFG